MRIFSWGSIIAGLCIFSAIFFLIGIWQPEVLGDWCGKNENWASCYRGWLGALAGYVALFVGAVSIMAIRAQIDASEKISIQAIEASEKIASQTSEYARSAKIARFVAALKVAMLEAESLNKTGGSTNELFLRWPELLDAEQDGEFQDIRKDIEEFNGEIDKYISLKTNAASANVESPEFGNRDRAYKRALELRKKMLSHLTSVGVFKN